MEMTCQPSPPQGDLVCGGRGVGLYPPPSGTLTPAAPRQKLDLERETIELVHTEPTDVAQLPSRVPREAARYHFFLYKHTHEGDPLESVGEWPEQGPAGGQAGVAGSQACLTHRPVPPPVFIYSMPGYKCSIKERMLYSSCKSRLLDSVEQDFQLEVSKKVGATPQGPFTPTPYMGHCSPETVAEQRSWSPVG